jgi:CelD/BcsL family acetyltransferase involved in cellulose biosynthesis
MELHHAPILDCVFLTSVAEIEKIAPEWQALHERASPTLFADFRAFEIWWRTLGEKEGTTPLVAIARGNNRELKAVLPLAVRTKRKLFRVAEQAGHEVFDHGDILAESESAADILWRFVRTQGCFDLALIKDIRKTDKASHAIGSSARLRTEHKNFFLTLNYSSAGDWLAAQSKKLRSDVQRKFKKLHTRGSAGFSFYQQGQALPTQVVDALYEQKHKWVAARYGKGCFMRPEMRDFLLAYAADAAQKGILYLGWLSCDQEIVAAHMGFIHNNTLYLYISSYNDAYSDFSPGNMMLAETIKYAIEQKCVEVDFMRGDEDYKQRFACDHRMLSDYVCGRTLIGKLAAWVR